MTHPDHVGRDQTTLASKLAGADSRPFAIRAENIQVHAESGGAPPDNVCAPGSVLAVQFHGAASRWQVQLDAGEVFSALVSEEETRRLNGLGVGARVKLCWPRAAAVSLSSGGAA